jgi:predicted porin
MKKLGFGAVLVASVIGALGIGAANAADMDAMATKAPPYAVAPAAVGPAACGSVYDFFLTACPLSWYGVTVYGTVDVGGDYQTHGTPLDPNHPVGASYLLGNSGSNAVGRITGFQLGPNALSQSVIGIRTNEPIAPGWNFISVNELAFDPYSLLLANAPQAMFNAIGVPENRQLVPYDSSRWGWLGAQNFVGVSSPIWGTLTFGRTNTPMLDAVNAYDPMGGSYAFSIIGNSGATCGAGDTETCRWTTEIKYRVNVGDFRFVVAGQPITGGQNGYNTYNPNNGAIEGGIGADFKHFGPGTLSVDVVGAYEVDAVNWTTLFTSVGGVGPTLANGYPSPVAFLGFNSGLKATISNNTSGMVAAKYSFGSWGDPAPPIVSKAPLPPSGPHGIPLTLYAGYEYIQFANPSDPVTTSFRDDGFLFNATNAAGSTLSGNGTTIANNAFNALCGSGTGCSDKTLQSMWAGAKYGITRDLDVIGAYYHYIQNTYVRGVNCSLANAAVNARCQGYFDGTSAVLDWRFLPKWDAYIGIFYTAAVGGFANGDISRSNAATTAGVRFRF